MKLIPHLVFNGQCEAAFRFYEQCFGGTIGTMLRWAKSPMAKEAPPGWGEKILHATLTIGDDALMGSDGLPGQYEQPKSFMVLLSIEDPVEAERVFRALGEYGTVQMQVQKTFWAVRFGVLTDQFGIPWEINCEQTA
jgi:PhnB protein